VQVRQKILQLVYPFLMNMGKLFGSASKVLFHNTASAPPVSLYNYSVSLNDGTELPLNTLKGKKILLVNTASDCGYTAQYGELQNLYDEFKQQLVVIAFPSNDFKEQETADDAAIAAFCNINYGVKFPLVKKSSVVKTDRQHPVFKWLSDPALNGWCKQAPDWNFSKYLVNENGQLTHYFPTAIAPSDEIVRKNIQNIKLT
jgi:glutathione peroxidase